MGKLNVEILPNKPVSLSPVCGGDILVPIDYNQLYRGTAYIIGDSEYGLQALSLPRQEIEYVSKLNFLPTYWRKLQPGEVLKITQSE